MRSIHGNGLRLTGIFTIIAFFVNVCLFCGCSYTILRDLEQERFDAEWAAIDSMVCAPNLTISSLDYGYRYEPGSDNVIDPIDSRGTHWVTFQLLVENVGDADYHESYTIVFYRESSRLSDPDNYYQKEFNREGDTLGIGEGKAIDLMLPYPYSMSRYTFVIVTNPIIQHDVITQLNRHSHSPRLPLRRESRFDDNSASIEVPSWRELFGRSEGQ